MLLPSERVDKSLSPRRNLVARASQLPVLSHEPVVDGDVQEGVVESLESLCREGVGVGRVGGRQRLLGQAGDVFVGTFSH
jgi:hypothetical protein